jgi:hypothetical protein
LAQFLITTNGFLFKIFILLPFQLCRPGRPPPPSYASGFTGFAAYSKLAGGLSTGVHISDSFLVTEEVRANACSFIRNIRWHKHAFRSMSTKTHKTVLQGDRGVKVIFTRYHKIASFEIVFTVVQKLQEADYVATVRFCSVCCEALCGGEVDVLLS